MMVIRFVPNKNNNQKIEEEQAVWRGTNCYVKISLINLKVSAICTGQRYSNVIKLHAGKLRPVWDKIVHEQIDKKCPKNTNSLNYLSAYLWLNTNHLRNFRSDNLSHDKSCEEIIINEQDKEKFQ